MDKTEVISQNCGTAHSEKIGYKSLLEKVIELAGEVYGARIDRAASSMLLVHDVEFTASELEELRRIEREISER